MGDVKLLGMLGAFFGFEAVLFTIFMGSLLGAVLGGTLILFKRFKFTHPLPFGPYLAAAAIWFVLSKPEMAFEIGEGFRFLFDSIF